MKNEPVHISKVVSEVMAIFARRREVETRIREGIVKEGDRAELEALNEALAR